MKFESVRSSCALFWPCPFTVEPQKGFIEAGQTTKFKANFAPMEADDFAAILKCVVPFRAGATSSELHWSVSPSCLSFQHRQLWLSHASASRLQISTSRRCSRRRIFSSGVRVKSPTRIEIVNPTGVAYERKWTVLSDNSDSTITCESRNALVPSGKRYIFVFNYSPRTPNLVESLWELSVSAQHIKVPFSIVGRISH